MQRNGWWKVYKVDESCQLRTVYDVTYGYYVPGMGSGIDPSKSGGSINGTAVSYAEYEAWEKSLVKKVDLDWAGQKAETFNSLLKKAKADKTGDLPTVTVGGFKDVRKGEYYADAVEWAVANGITNGLTSTAFGPGNTCTRGQIVTFLHRSQ